MCSGLLRKKEQKMKRVPSPPNPSASSRHPFSTHPEAVLPPFCWTVHHPDTQSGYTQWVFSFPYSAWIDFPVAKIPSNWEDQRETLQSAASSRMDEDGWNLFIHRSTGVHSQTVAKDWRGPDKDYGGLSSLMESSRLDLI